MSETPTAESQEGSKRTGSPLGRIRSWDRSTKALTVIAMVLALALVASLAVLNSWRGNAHRWKDHALDVEEERDALQSDIEGLHDELAKADAEIAAVKDLQVELGEREETLAARAEELDAIEAIEEEREEAQEGGLTVGSTTTHDDWEITLVAVETHGRVGDSSPRGKYVVLLLDVTNNASHEREFLGGFTSGFNLFDVENDREYEFDDSASLDYHQTFNTDAWYLEDLGPGLSGRIPIAIDVSEDTSWGLAAMVTSSEVSDTWLVEDL